VKNYKFYVLAFAGIFGASVVFASVKRNAENLRQQSVVQPSPEMIKPSSVPNPSRRIGIVEMDRKSHDTAGTPRTTTEDGSTTGKIFDGPTLITSPGLVVDYIAPKEILPLNKGDAICVTYQRFPSGAIANLTATKGPCDKH
jgi:hypothetical protein